MKIIMKCVNVKLWDIPGCFHYILNAPRISRKRVNIADTNLCVVSSISFDRTFLEICLLRVFCSDQSKAEGAVSFCRVLLTGIHLNSSFLKCLEQTTVEGMISNIKQCTLYVIFKVYIAFFFES